MVMEAKQTESKYVVCRTSLDLTPGIGNFLKGVHNRFPYLPDEDVEALTNTLLGEVGEHLEVGEDIAFVKRNQDGTATLTVLGLEPIDEEISQF